MYVCYLASNKFIHYATGKRFTYLTYHLTYHVMRRHGTKIYYASALIADRVVEQRNDRVG